MATPSNEDQLQLCDDRVLCTGASGFLGGHVALQLLDAGYRVRGSVRDAAKGAAVRATLAGAGADLSRLELVTLDLLSDEGWFDAAKDCRYVVHTASPFVLTMPKDPLDLVRPAVEGTRRAVHAALRAGAERIVLTSSIAAIVYGHKARTRIFTEDDWADLDGPNVTAYIRSKTLAEREAWTIVENAQRRDALAVINPGGILGPLLDDDPGTTGALVVRLLRGAVPAAPGVRLEWVDVRDVAAAHVAALTQASAGGRRHIVSGNVLSLMDIARILAAEFPAYARKMPRFEMPNWMVRIAGIFDSSLRDVAPELGMHKCTDASRVEKLLGHGLISAEEAAIATARSVIELGIVR